MQVDDNIVAGFKVILIDRRPLQNRQQVFIYFIYCETIRPSEDYVRLIGKRSNFLDEKIDFSLISHCGFPVD